MSVSVKKVKPFPIPLTLKTASGDLQGQVVKLTIQGFIASASSVPLQPGDKLECSFELPVIHEVIATGCVLIKLYGHATMGNLIEFHFLSLTTTHRMALASFLKAISPGAAK